MVELFPTDLVSIMKLYLTDLRENSVNYNYDKRDELARQVNDLIHPDGTDTSVKTGKISRRHDSLLNAYAITRSMVQANEACNKVWATVELLHALSYWTKGYPEFFFSDIPESPSSMHKPLCDTFQVDFCGGTVLPTLYYAHISSLTSIMSSFGCVSIRDSTNELSYNIVRTRSGWNVFERKKFIQDLTGNKPSGGWHNQLYQIIDGLSSNLSGFPQINIDFIKQLAQTRNERHYEILGSVDAKLSRGLDEYFDYVPDVINTIYSAIFIITQVYQRHGLSGYSRFLELHSNIPNLFKEYSKKLPDLINIDYLK